MQFSDRSLLTSHFRLEYEQKRVCGILNTISDCWIKPAAGTFSEANKKNDHSIELSDSLEFRDKCNTRKAHSFLLLKANIVAKETVEGNACSQSIAAVDH